MLRMMLQIIQHTVKIMVLVIATVHGVTLQIEKGMLYWHHVCGCVACLCTSYAYITSYVSILTSCAHTYHSAACPLLPKECIEVHNMLPLKEMVLIYIGHIQYVMD